MSEPDVLIVGPGRPGGLTWGELDKETQTFGLATTGGLVTTTGIAGFTLGGGPRPGPGSPPGSGGGAASGVTT